VESHLVELDLTIAVCVKSAYDPLDLFLRNLVVPRHVLEEHGELLGFDASITGLVHGVEDLLPYCLLLQLFRFSEDPSLVRPWAS
jgi:hypothetical protein